MYECRTIETIFYMYTKRSLSYYWHTLQGTSMQSWPVSANVVDMSIQITEVTVDFLHDCSNRYNLYQIQILSDNEYNHSPLAARVRRPSLSSPTKVKSPIAFTRQRLLHRQARAKGSQEKRRHNHQNASVRYERQWVITCPETLFRCRSHQRHSRTWFSIP